MSAADDMRKKFSQNQSYPDPLSAFHALPWPHKPLSVRPGSKKGGVHAKPTARKKRH